MQEQVGMEGREVRAGDSNTPLLFSAGAVFVVMVGLLVFRALNPRSR